jgi:hypothetical protein
MRKLYVPTESLFLEDLIENYASEYQQKSQSTYKCLDCAIDIQGTEFYERFSKYSAKYCPQNQVKSMKKFYADLDSLQFPMKIIKPQNKTTYRFNLKECYIHMLNRGWRDQNENDDLFTEEEEVQECDDYDFNLV